jgi:hypothetical protein
VVVNTPCSQGAAGMGTHLAPTFTIGTGFFGRSSVGENIGPQHLVNWTRIAWPSDGDDPIDAMSFAQPAHKGPLPEAPSDGVPGKTRPAAAAARKDETSYHALRDEIRRIIAEELRSALKG